MPIIGGQIAYRLLKLIAPSSRYEKNNAIPIDIDADSELEIFFGDQFFELIQGKTVVDFGCGEGIQSVEMAARGAAEVTGIDIQLDRLDRCRTRAERHNLADKCSFQSHYSGKADIIISKDAFEHFDDPAAILQLMSSLLKPEGFILASFGPTWLHPYGGHLFSVFPWSHLLFTESAQIRWRAEFKDDGASCFAEVDGGLNQLTIKMFEELVESSPLRITWLETVPIKNLSFFKFKSLREYGSSIVRCKLELKEPN